MAKKIVFAVILIITVVVIILFLKQKNPAKRLSSMITQKSQEKAVDYKASFGIFTHGTFRIFTAAMYHNLSDDVFIQSDNPNIVHVKKGSITWGDFFNTLPFKLTKECLTTGTGETFCSGKGGTLRFYLNRVRDNDLLSKPIGSADTVLVTFGNEDDSQIQREFQSIPQIK